MGNAQITTSVTIINSGLIGYQGISLTDFATTTVSAIAAGSGIEIAGAFFKFSTNETINASSWTAITTATTAYLGLTPSGTAGSQILTAAWISSAPVWETSKQGWYSSAGSSIRVVASVYKGSATQYLNKFILENNQDTKFRGIEERIITGSGNWIVPTGIHRIRVKCIGGGGGGTSSSDSGVGSGGGGTNIGSVPWSIINVIPGQLIAYSVGAGGASNAAGNDTTFTGAITGIKGGVGVTGGAGGAGPAIGGIDGGSAQSSGNTGGSGGVGGRGGTFSAGTGGNSPYYGGGGGGGGIETGPIYRAGGAGGSGIIIIEY